ncbi:AMMECR1 domain-containing protein [Ceratobasidium sp. AG-Ba]|nr:AMMECR1 domain-containing protein [Ceratobasidium sp. AG-Ba]
MSDIPADADTSTKPETCVVEHCYYAFDTLYCTLTNEEPVDVKHLEQYLQGEFPLFVTWNTVSTRLMGGVRLRGCIGNFEPMQLEEGIKEYALISALHDHRFRPIEEKELRKLECCVSLLTDFEDATSYLDWESGTHGIYITLMLPILPAQPTDDSSAPSPMSSSTFLARSKPPGRQRKLTATYLPDVIPAQGWTKQEAVDSALRKAGFDGRITEEVRRAVKLRRYQSSVASVRWDKYWEWRQGLISKTTQERSYHDQAGRGLGIMTSPEQLFNSLKLQIYAPDEVLALPEPSVGSSWIHKLEELPERPAAYFDERLQFYLVVKAPSKPAGGPGPTPPLYLLNFLVYLQVAIEAIYVPSYTPASGSVSPRPPAKLRLPQPPNASSSLNIPAHSSPLRNSVQNQNRPVPLHPPETPNPMPMMSDSERILGRTDMGVVLQSYFWGEENDGQRKVGIQDERPSFRLLWLPEEDSWAIVYRLEVTVEYLRVRMQDPVLCLTASTTLRDKPMSATPQRKELIEMFKSAGGVYDVVKSKTNGNVPPKDEDTSVEDVMYGLEEVNLLEGLTEGITFTPENPGDKLSLSTSRMGTGVRRQAFSLAPTPNRPEPLSPASVGTTTATPLSTRPLPTLRKAFRKTLPTASGIQVRLLPSFVPHAFTDNDLVDHDEDAGEEHSVVLSVELENSAGYNSGFLVEKVQVSVNGEDSQTRLLGITEFPLALRSHDQYNLLYAVMFMLPPDLLEHAPSGRR